ncbi:MAG: hypothetical protein AMXMBFR33_64180 [Candidatus Xenobia bacterium]|jgi:hypothetical protein
MTSKTEENTFENLADQWRQMWLDNWASVTRTTVDSDSFKNANAAAFNWTLAGQKMWRDAMGQALESMDLPRRSDLARLSRQIAALEARVLDMQEELAQTRKAAARPEPKPKAQPKTQPKTAPAKAANQKGKSK